MNYMESGMADVARRLHEAQTQRDELLETLESFVDFPSDTFDGDHDGSFTMTAQLSLMRKARAIIAKAKVEQK